MATPKVSENPTVQRHYLAQLALSAALAQAVRTLFASTSPLSGEGGRRSFAAGLRRWSTCSRRRRRRSRVTTT